MSNRAVLAGMLVNSERFTDRLTAYWQPTRLATCYIIILFPFYSSFSLPVFYYCKGTHISKKVWLYGAKSFDCKVCRPYKKLKESQLLTVFLSIQVMLLKQVVKKLSVMSLVIAGFLSVLIVLLLVALLVLFRMRTYQQVAKINSFAMRFLHVQATLLLSMSLEMILQHLLQHMKQEFFTLTATIHLLVFPCTLMSPVQMNS